MISESIPFNWPTLSFLVESLKISMSVWRRHGAQEWTAGLLLVLTRRKIFGVYRFVTHFSDSQSRLLNTHIVVSPPDILT